MKAVVVEHPGGVDAMQWRDVPDPEAGPGEVVVDVVAAGVNRADLLQRQGHYPPPPGAPDYLGLECSGHITALGAGVTDWSVGDEVCALLAGGAYAERVAVPAGQVLPCPEGVDLVHAAALPEVTCTVWSNVFMLARLMPGDWLLVHGGASGIGTMAVQLANELGAMVAVTAGSQRKLDRCAELGADVLIDYTTQDFVAELKEVTSGKGADVVLDIIGAKYLTRNVDVLAIEGRLVVIGLQGGTKGELDLNALMRKRAAILATTLRSRPVEEKTAIVASVREHVWPMVEEATVRPVVDRVVPDRDVAEAHRAVETGEPVGKVLVQIS